MKTQKVLSAIGFMLILIYSCSSPVLVGKKYIYNGEYYQESLQFISKNECTYEQLFVPCGMSPRYEHIKIICTYKFRNNIIEVNNKYPIDSLKNSTHIRIPFEEIEKCKYLRQYTIDPIPNGKIMIGRPSSFNDGYYLGYLNYIEKEKLLYQDSLIIYLKSYSEPTEFSDRGWARNVIFTDMTKAIDSITKKQIIRNIVLNKSILKKIANGK